MPRLHSLKCLEDIALDAVVNRVFQLAALNHKRNECSDRNYEMLLKFLTPVNFVKQIITNCKGSLEELQLRNIELNNTVLMAIGECRELHYLDISKDAPNSQYLPFRSLMRMFCHSGKPTALTHSLTQLHMTNVECKEDGASYFIAMLFLNWCPKLEQFSHSTLWDGLGRLCQLNCGPKHLRLTGGHHDSNTLHIATLEKEYGNDGCSAMLQCVPGMHSFNIVSRNEERINVLHIIQRLGLRLTNLNLTWEFPYSLLAYIGPMCPNLKTVFLTVLYKGSVHALNKNAKAIKKDFEKSSSNTSSASVKPWSNLNKLKLLWQHVPGHLISDSEMFGEDMSFLLKTICENSAGSLQSLYIKEVDGLDLDILTEMFQNGTLCSLKRFTYVGFEITADVIWDWLTSNNSLKILEIFNSDTLEFEKHQIMQYIRERNLDVKLTVALK
ncbi:unnamed protein product [Clavelina lepadiformis]|uniref:Uncharacterized protein n=1 Tax=Clavelina lepadiformis TaxID=159417 RepID=A0ABP0G8U7_CLALP